LFIALLLVPEPPEYGRLMRLGWAKLLKRVFNLDLTHCPHCGGDLRMIAAMMQRQAPKYSGCEMAAWNANWRRLMRIFRDTFALRRPIRRKKQASETSDNQVQGIFTEQEHSTR
jgi:hypothetical protein